MNERLKDLRKTLNLSQDAFGERIGMSGGAISLLEKGKRNITEQVVKSICREYSVDYMWLTTGDGEMFMESDDDFMEKIDRIMAGENDARKNMIKTLLNASDADIEALDNLIEIKKKTDSLSTVSLVGVKVRHEFVYPLEGFFTSYLSDHLDDDVSVLDSNHPFRFRLYHGFPQSWKCGRRFPQSWKYIHLLPVANHTVV